jgi:hypothetical protein
MSIYIHIQVNIASSAVLGILIMHHLNILSIFLTANWYGSAAKCG